MEEWDFLWVWGIHLCERAEVFRYELVDLGDYENGIKHGQGTYEYSNGRKYVGEWKNGKQDGYGKLFIYDKIAFEGNF